ncbi:transcriptional regulator [Pseudomonas bohemica]|uniref:transcriptional regulator n=1 Tax=Pseudomonas bohemica TaxID=2044872 RepID=UPI000DA5F750|nr:transcriptional regulator [Pseudomonas bohemica]
MSNKYDWDLIERLLHEVQNGADKTFAPRKYAEEHAATKAQAGESVESLDALKMSAADLEALLLKRGFIESRPEEEGGNGENFILTPRGSSLLAMIDSSIPGNAPPRQVLDDQTDALDPNTFDTVSSKAQVAPGAI